MNTYRQAKVMLWMLLTCGQHVRCGYEASRHDAIENERQRQRPAQLDSASNSERTLGQIALSARRKGEPPQVVSAHSARGSVL